MANTKTSTSTTKKSGASKFTLPNKKVTLVPIVRKKSFMGRPDHDGLFMFTGSFQAWQIFRDEYGNYIDPLNYSERVYLEEVLGEDLNVNHKDNFWKKFEVKIKKDTYDLSNLKKVFDLSKPLDYLAYKLLLTAPDVAKSLKEKDETPEYRWVLIEKDEPIQEKITKGKMKIKCYSWLEENETKTAEMRDILYAMNLPVSRDTSKDTLVSNIIDLIEGPKLEDLYNLITAEDFNTRILLSKALKVGAIKYRKQKFYDMNGELIAMNRQAVLDWLTNPENDVAILEIKKMVDKSKL